MLSQQDNETLTHVGPGTPMGGLLRQYWAPALLSDELPSPDCPPIRIKLMCEELIAFRNTSGEVGLVANACPHRAASMFFGRNEEDGLRCVYHGWKFDVTGQCTDMLSEPAESEYKNKVKITAYPCVERGGIVWTYMGSRSREDLPPLPDLEPNLMAEQGRGTVRVNMFEWNWFQCMENNMDTAHQGILHFGSVTYEDAIDPERAQKAYPGPVEDLKYIVKDRAPRFLVRDTDFGCSYGVYRPADEGNRYYRTMHWAFPWVTMTPVIKMGQVSSCVLTVPIDDTHCMSWGLTTGRLDQPPGTNPPPAGQRGLLPNDNGWYGRFRLEFWDRARQTGYDFDIDREEQKTSRTMTGYSGLPSVPVQDGAITWSQGAIVDRSHEHLGTTDSMLIRVRRRLLDAAKAYAANGSAPPCVDTPEVYRQRSGWIVLPEEQDYWEASRPLREAFQKVELPTATS